MAQPHVPFHTLANVQRPPCSTQGLAPWHRPQMRFNDVKHVVIDDATRVSDVVGQTRTSTKGEPVLLDLPPWQHGQAMPPILAIEADCNLGKSYAVFHEMMRPRLLANPELPMLFFSVRITHAYDLYGTLQRYFVDDEGEPIDAGYSSRATRRATRASSNAARTRRSWSSRRRRPRSTASAI
jgi:hypothetical protein